MINRYTASADNTITNAFDSSLSVRGISANMGLSDSLETFYITNQAYLSSSEKSRILIKFETDKMVYDRSVGALPSSGSVEFYLKMFNIEHHSTLPKNCVLSILPISTNWTEGNGLDMEEYTDLYTSNWMSASDGVAWTTEGGDFLDSPVYTANLFVGDEDISVNITDLVEYWIDETIPNYGVCVKLSGTYETGSESRYTKKFSARGTEYFFNRPVIEAVWNSASIDDRGNFFVSSALADSTENTNNIYLVNKIRGLYRNIPAFEPPAVLTVGVYDSLTGSNSFGTFSANKISTGIYSASISLATTSSSIYDRWFADGICYYTGTINIRAESNIDDYYINIQNLKPKYSINEKTDLRVFTRGKNWHPTVYTKATTQIVPDIIENLHYCIIRPADNLKVIDYDIVNNSTKLSYDVSGSYFTLNTSLLEEDYQYEIRFKSYYDSFSKEFAEKFRFRVIKDSE